MSDSIKTILVAIDPSPAGKHAFIQALRLAQSMRAKLIATSVTPRYEGNMHRWVIKDAEEQFNKPYKDCLQEAVRTTNGFGNSVRIVHRVGEPAEEIVTLAEEEGADLLIMGCPAASYVKRVFLGRTTAKVIGMSPCDVMMIPENAEVNFARMLVGVDGSGYSIDAGQRALDLAMEYGGEVHALTVLDVPIDRSLLYGVLGEARHKNFTALQTLANQGETLGVPVITEMREGSPYENIVKYSEEKEIQLIVLGSYGRTALGRILLGSVVERVTALSPLPTLVVKRRGSNEGREMR
jgi:nucleotide-binding universal stress UspA family protein